MTANSQPKGLPSFDPQGTESIEEIPARFLIDGLLTLRADGVWMSKGEKIRHLGLSKFLARQLRRTQEGEYWVVNGPQRAWVNVEDAPFVVKRVLFDGEDVESSAMTAVLNDDSKETLWVEHLFMNEEGVLYTRVKKGEAGAHDDEDHLARVSSEALLDLETLFVEMEDGSIGMQHQGKVHRLG